MDIERHNQDLRILQREAPLPRFGAEPPGWKRVDWRPTAHGGNIVILEQLVLPGVCSPRRTDLRIEAPPNLYDRAPSGKFYFYRNIWVSPGLKLWDRRSRCWKPVPRLHAPTPGSRFAYLCIHPGLASREANILDLLRVFDLHLLNPGLHATGEETV
jgi:hypothetical protein